MLLAIHNEIRGCKAKIQGCRSEIRSCRDDVNCQEMNGRISNFEKKVEVSFSTFAGTLSKHEGKFREINEWTCQSQKGISDCFKIYDERSDALLISATELPEQAESLESKGPAPQISARAEIRRTNGEVEANSCSVVEMTGTLIKGRTILHPAIGLPMLTRGSWEPDYLP